MDNYKDYSGLKSANSSNWGVYGAEQECPTASGKWHSCSSMDQSSNYQTTPSSCYYAVQSGAIKTEYEPLYEPSNGDGFSQNFKYSYLSDQGDARALISPPSSLPCHSSSSIGITSSSLSQPSQQSHSSQQIACPPPDSTFNSSDSGSSDIASKTARSSTHISRLGKGKAEKHHKLSSHCNVSGGGNSFGDGQEDGNLSRKVILRPHSTPATLMWLENNYELAEGVCIPRSVLYLHYVDFCSINRVQPVNAASFGKIIRQQFPHLTTRRLGTRGQSRYHYYGIGIKESSAYYQLSYSKKSVQMHSIADSTNKSSHHLKGGNSLYSKQHHQQNQKQMQGKMMQGATKMPLDDSKLINNPGTTLCYDDGGMFEQSSAASSAGGHHLELSTAHSGQLYGNFGGSTPLSKHYKVDRFDSREQGSGSSTLVVDHHQFGQLSSPGTSKMSPSGSLVSSFVPSLPPFPTAEELELCHAGGGGHNNLVSTFLLMYRAHCQRILDAIVRANFEELNTLVYHFWQKIPHHLVPVLSSPLLINLLGICDIRLYRTIIKLISVTLGQPLTEIAYTQLENFVSSLDSVLGAALHKENALLQQVKLELARHFGGIVRCLLRHSRVYHSVQGSGNGGSSAHCQAALKQLYLDWSRLDLSAVADHLVEQYVQLCCRGNGSGGLQTDHGCLKRVHQILYQHCAEFKLFLATFTDYSQLFDWFESVWQVSLQWYHSCAVSAHSRKNTTWSGLEFSRYFIVLWTCARLHIGQELSRIKAPSANLFSTLSALFDDFCVYKVKDLYFDDCISMLFSNAAQNSKPTLPQYFEPFDLMKQTASFLEEYETSTVADGTGEQPWLNSNSQQGVSRVAGYHEVYSNLHSNALWLSYSGQQQQSQGSSMNSNSAASQQHYSESGQQYSGGGLQQNNCSFAASSTNAQQEYASASEHQQQHQPRSHRPDSLICFSMNFHANSIQVMTAPNTSTASSAHTNNGGSGGTHRAEAVVTEDAEAAAAAGSGGQFSSGSSSAISTVDSSSSSSSSSSCRIIKSCSYQSHSSDCSPCVDAAVAVSVAASNASGSNSSSISSINSTSAGSSTSLYTL